MLSAFRILALSSTALIATAVMAQTAPPAPPAATAQSPAVFDLSQLPAFKGEIQQFTTTPRGDIDGMILADGTEVKLPPHLTREIAAAFKVGDAVTVRGLKAAAIPLVAASSVTNDATGVAVIDNGPEGPGRAAGDATPTDMQGRMKAALHGRRGEVNGALLEDGTVLRLPPHEAARFAALLAPGQTVAVRGTLMTSAYGKVIEVLGLGTSPDKLSEVEGPPPGGKKGGPKGPKG